MSSGPLMGNAPRRHLLRLERLSDGLTEAVANEVRTHGTRGRWTDTSDLHEAAREVVSDVCSLLASGGSIMNEGFRRRTASLVHDQWVARNREAIESAAAGGDVEAPVHLLQPFQSLSHHEQQDVFAVVDTGTAAVTGFLTDLSSFGREMEPSPPTRSTPGFGFA